MKKAVCLVLSLVVVLSCSAALAAGKLNVAQENFIVTESYSTYGYAFAKVENIGDKAVDVNAGVLEIFDGKGDVITSEDYLSRYARTLQPGEYTYCSISAKIDNPDSQVKPYDYSLTITGKSEIDHTTIRFPVETKLALKEKSGYSTNNYLYAFVTNNSSEVVFNMNVVFALLDANGSVLFVSNETLYNTGITPGSSVVMRTSVPDYYLDAYSAAGFVPVVVDAIAYIDK